MYKILRTLRMTVHADLVVIESHAEAPRYRRKHLNHKES